MKISLFTFILTSIINCAFTQTDVNDKLNYYFFDGNIISGYVDQGAYINFTGPNISISKNKTKVSLGMLPTLRIKKDPNAIKNSPITPSLGFGITWNYKWLALQIPIYYNTKTTSKNGSWELGFGIGVNLKSLFSVKMNDK
jgi:hypothetical protein